MAQYITSGDGNSLYLSAYSSISDSVVLDSFFYSDQSNTVKTLAKYILVGTGGNIVWENPNGELQYLEGAVDSGIYPIFCARILSAGTVRGTARTTTASNMVWLGGY